MKLRRIVLITVFIAAALRVSQDIGLLTFYHGLPSEYKCESLANDDRNPEHISYYNQTTLFVSKIGMLSLFIQVGAETESGYIQVIAKADKASPEIYAPEMIGFPEGVRFHPFGHYYNNRLKTLAVINPAYTYGGERIEIFKVSLSEETSRLVLTHQRSIVLPEEEFRGKPNSIVMPEEDLIYFTTWISETDDPQGKPFNPFYFEYIIPLKFLLRIPITKVYQVNLRKNGEAIFSILPGNYIEANGITLDQDNRLYVNDVFGRSISIYNKEKTKIEKTLYFDTHLDNLAFSAKDKMIYAAGFHRALDNFKLPAIIQKNGFIPEDVEDWSEVWEIDTSKPTEELDVTPSNRILSEKGNIRGASSAVKSGKYIYFGSWSDKGPLRCERV